MAYTYGKKPLLQLNLIFHFIYLAPKQLTLIYKGLLTTFVNYAQFYGSLSNELEW